MKLPRIEIFLPRAQIANRGSVLIIVLWVAFGLVSITLYFANSMSMELRASDNRVAGVEAEQAIAGAACYVSNILANLEQPGTLPDPQNFRAEAVPVGNATFWLIGRETNNLQMTPDQMAFGLVDEAAKINLNTATAAMLQNLPGMTPNLAAAIFDWRNTNSTVSSGGAKSETYSLLQPPYLCKSAPFETVDELRLVFGTDLNLLYGEDSNLNGILDANEDDADVLPPTDNHDGQLDPGLLEYVTVYSREPNVTSNGTARVSVANTSAVQRLLSSTFPRKTFQRVSAQSSVLALYWQLVDSGQKFLTAAEFAQVEPGLRNTNIVGLVNINTASVAVLTCIPGIDTNNAVALINYRNANPDKLNTITWVAEALSSNTANWLKAGPYITTHTYQFTADIAAVGHYGRGYRRVKFIFDTSEGAPKIIYRQDLTHLGWALGRQTREKMLLAKEMR